MQLYEEVNYIREGSMAMTLAEKIMKKKRSIKAEIDQTLSKEQSDALWKKATERLEQLLRRYDDLPAGVRAHTDNYIFPSAAIYLTAKDYMTEQQAYAVIEQAAIVSTTRYGEMFANMMKLPFMRDLFIRVWDPMTKKKFGKDSGFQNRFYPEKKGEYRMDILACPYCRYFTELGCFELTKIFCENDERVYGNLPGLAFERTGTLGKGAECCDFCIRKVPKQ